MTDHDIAIRETIREARELLDYNDSWVPSQKPIPAAADQLIRDLLVLIEHQQAEIAEWARIGGENDIAARTALDRADQQQAIADRQAEALRQVRELCERDISKGRKLRIPELVDPWEVLRIVYDVEKR